MPTVLEFAKELLGDVKTVDLLYNPGDANDVVNVEYARKAVEDMGMTLKAISVGTTGDIAVRVEALKDADFIYLIPPSMLHLAIPAVAAAARRNKIPVINASPGGTKDGLILALMFVSWFDVGRQAGLRAAEILNSAKPSSLSGFRPSPEDHRALISAKHMDALGMTLSGALDGCDCVE